MKRKNSFSKVNKAALFTAASAAVLSIGASAAFTKISTYTDGQFSDVNSEAWFAGEVKNTYELGLMNGTREKGMSVRLRVGSESACITSSR